ncbi:hypothetical protein NtRootD5_34220 [Arthrobacter sp. NtRootD5]|nr:hypothetical protein NtRootD5_34220 [Arthrobacter sp. NtRootD5]
MGVPMHWYKKHSSLRPSRGNLDWLNARSEGDLPYFTGMDAAGWEDSTWILNAFYELPSNRTLPTHDELRKASIVAGDEEPLMFGEVNLDEMTIATGSELGYATRPPADWQRRTWAEMLLRFPHPHPAGGPPPCYRWFPATDFPANIQLPTEGSMSEEDFSELIDVLSRYSPTADCSVYFANVFSTYPDPCEAPVYDTNLTKLPSLIREISEDRQVFTPANIWSSDRSWLVYTDYDLWATKVSSSSELINELRANPLLETLDWAPGGSSSLSPGKS